ncbi:YceI family protein [Mangrovimonas sp. AS39]|uniref:YceI family protein n=1 Tax=Mangrovimonas TaxID=1211036 RepID=UPI0006B5E6F2|nr:MULTISPECIES: YceI family protein [Mangrovimonas]MCF1192869.1 YceI family protein [Mangrovimonas futianensis]MCF1196529.1 YceI family protein [Mangrovimonas futianensis]MCF1423065.1 YceI family protein [Mangrovimonas futianensis]NIK93429.1 YceI family protein [Mangrovimonas sp. CR14]
MKLIATAVLVLAVITNPIKKEKKMIKAEESKVVWKGYKVAGAHEGTIAVKSGNLEFNGEELVGGSFVMDMTSIGSTDLSGEYKDQLDGHLKSDDFFGVEKYPTSSLTFTEVTSTGKNSYEVTGDLTIKGTTHPITFDLSVYGSKASASVKVDRSKYDVRYGSSSFFGNLKDKVIYDEFDIVADLQF